MSNKIRSIEPQSLWGHFADLNAIPRASKKEEQVIEFVKNFGESLDLETIVDHIGNVIIKKPATIGMEDREIVALQSHLDMVHQKNNNTSFDFSTEGINMYQDGDWVTADGTTLGADNGIGVAAIMAILNSTDIPHPAIEALFTIDEETGMTGALELKGGMLDAGIMLNLDTEDDDELTVGCAGGIDVTASGTYTESERPESFIPIKIIVNGLTGGHSGMDIHKGRGNGNKLMNRLLYELNKDSLIKISSVDGGGLRNAIPRESVALVYIDSNQKDKFDKLFNKIKSDLKNEYKVTDEGINIEWTSEDHGGSILSKEFQTSLLRSIYTCPNGIYRMSPDIKDLVQTSNNLARVEVKEGRYKILCLTRSSVDSEKMDEVNSIASSFELIGAKVEANGSYPGWTPNPNSPIVSVMRELYEEMFNESPKVNACHAGLECGILGTHYPHIQMISFGPNIRGAHSPDEKVQISSVQKFWTYFLRTLKNIPIKTV